MHVILHLVAVLRVDRLLVIRFAVYFRQNMDGCYVQERTRRDKQEHANPKLQGDWLRIKAHRAQNYKSDGASNGRRQSESQQVFYQRLILKSWVLEEGSETDWGRDLVHEYCEKDHQA